MTRRFSILAIVLAATLIATNSADAGVLRYIGVKGAWSSSGANSDMAEGIDSDIERKTGVALGGEIEWRFGPNYSLRTDFEYSQRGWTVTGTTQGQDQETSLNYLNIPVLLQFTFPALIAKPFVQIGPRIDYLFGVDSDEFGDEVPEDWTKLLVGGSVAAGVSIHKFHPIVINGLGRYDFSFTDLSDVENIEIKSNTIQVWIGMGYSFAPTTRGMY